MPQSPSELSRAAGATTANSVLQSSAWCGLVVALVGLFAALNAVPPIPVKYRVRTQVILSLARLVQLKEMGSVDRAWEASVQDAIQASPRIVHLRVLDQGREQRSLASAGKTTAQRNVVLVEVLSEWNARKAPEHVLAWIEQLSTVEVPTAASDSLARELRRTRWELFTAEHYATHQQHVAAIGSARQPAEHGSTFQLATNGKSEAVGVPSTLASHRSQGSSSATDQAVAEARQKVQASEAAWTRHVQQLSGQFQPTGVHSIAARPRSIPTYFAASVIVFGVATGALAGWFQYRLQSGGSYDPRLVAEQLSRLGIPHVGEVVLVGTAGEQRGWTTWLRGGLFAIQRLTSRRFLRLSELVLAGWCAVIIARAIGDPLWCDMLTCSPLAAFGRLVTGLP